MSTDEKEEVITGLTAKEIKKLAKPEFAANPDKFYPTGTLKRLGFSRASCSCGNNYWRHSEKRTTCGDSQCEKKYNFIGIGTGVGRSGNKITYAQAWEGFKRSLSSARVPCTAISRYPVVARWRADVDYVAAGIFCFQPYCVTGELEPPANPLICPQFCLRFNDLDNIGLTGRHYSGFIMLGIQVFNKPDAYKFWHDECVEFNYRWLTEELKIDPDEITFIEDVWAGGGNLGPSIEYFVSGLELGNMVFMQYKTYPDGSREPLQVQVIDVGIGLERVPWLVNGSATSYMDVFPRALDFLLEKTKMNISTDIWDKYGPYSCLLNVDEVDDLDKIWKFIGDQTGMDPVAVRQAIEPIRDVYVVLDHTRSILMAIVDGSLPSNVGGGSNVRNILRRVFAILHKRKWWDCIGMEGLLTLFRKHQEDLATIYGPFNEYKSFDQIIQVEYSRWVKTDGEQREKLEKLAKKSGGKLSLNDWITAITAWGLPADTIASITGQDIPGNLWYAIAELQERTVKATPAVLYSTAHLPETVSTYYNDHKDYDFDASILQVIPNVTKKNQPSVVVLNRSAFYPTSGGQEHDIGTLTIDGTTYNVVDVLKVGPAVLHIVDPPLPLGDGGLDAFVGKAVTGRVDEERRSKLRNHHTATHIIYAASRRVLGPHIWQHGAKKTEEQAHLDITHYENVTFEQLCAIETEANRIVQSCKDVNKRFMPKDEAEKLYGFNLYQGGIVPGNTLRVVQILDTDTEACCGTHCDNTAEVGYIKIMKAERKSDGVVRLIYVAGSPALRMSNEQSAVLNSLKTEWRVTQEEIVPTAQRFFEGFKKYETLAKRQSLTILELQMRLLLADSDIKVALLRSQEKTATNYITNMPSFAAKFKELGKGVVVVGDNWIYGLFGNATLFDLKKFEAQLIQIQADTDAKKAAEEKFLAEKNNEKKEKEDAEKDLKKEQKKAIKIVTKNQVVSKSKDKKKKDEKIDSILEFTSFANPHVNNVLAHLSSLGFTALDSE